MRRSLILALSVLLSLAAVPSFAAPVATQPVAPTPVTVDPAFPQAFTDRVLGDEKAPVTIIEYAALTCPHCAHFHKDVLPQLKKDYIDTGKVKIIFKDFPFNLKGLHASMAARCLEPKSFFDFVGSLFTTQESWAEAEDGETKVQQMAGFAGLSPEQYKACTSSKSLQDHLMNGRVEATNTYHIDSTPTFIIKGSLERIVGAQDYASFKAVIDRQLAKLKQ